jgi:hypothetical protein
MSHSDATRGQRPFAQGDVVSAIARISQEVEHCAIVPDVEAPKVLDRRYISLDPINPVRTIPNARLGHFQSSP